MAFCHDKQIAPRVFAVLVALVFVSGTRSLAADDPPVGSPLPSDPVFEALRTDGSVASGRIRQLGPEGQVVLVGDDGDVTISFDDLVKLTRDGDPPASPPAGPVLVLPEGDRLRAAIGSSTETTLEVFPPLLGEAPLTVPLDAPLALLLAPAGDPAAQEALLARCRGEARDSEVFWLANGDRLAGGFLGLSARTVSLQRNGVASTIDRGGVVALGFDPAIVSYPAPESPYLELTFIEGSRLGVRDCRVEQGRIIATSRFGQVIRPALADLARVHVRGPSVAYLSDRKEALAEYVGYLGAHRRRYARDETLDGRILRVGGQPYDRGLATESRTLLAYRLAPGDRRFQATVGLDDRAGPLGSVVFRVLVDGKERFATPPMTARDVPRPIDLDLSGARVLILATEFGERGDVQDQADWIEARLVRSPK